MRRFYLAVSLTTICVLGLSAAGQADAWGTSLWTDDFEDGNYTANPAWTVSGTPGASQAVATWEGDDAFHLTSPYYDAVGVGFSLAYVNNAITDQRLLVWVDMSPLVSDDAATLCLLRYSPPALFFGTGYAVAIFHAETGPAITAQLVESNDPGLAPITDLVSVSETYTDVWVRAVAMGTGTNTRVLARVWAAGQPEPSSWMLDSDVPGITDGMAHYYDSGSGGVATVAFPSISGMAHYYDSGSGGVGTVALQYVGPTADAYFDDLDFVQVTLSAEPRW